MDWKGYRLSYLTTLNEYEVSNTRLAMMRLEYRLFEHLTQYFLRERDKYIMMSDTTSTGVVEKQINL